MIVRSLKYRIIIVVLIVLLLYGIVSKLIGARKFDVSLARFFREVSLPRSAYVQLNTETCIFPKMSSQIKDLTPLFRKSPPLKCNYKTQDWVTCEKSKCFVKKTILFQEQNVRCTFIDVMFNTDYGIYDGALKSDVTTYTLNKSDVVKVYCKSKSNSWSSVLVGIRSNISRYLSGRTNPTGLATNVLIIGFPSVSRNTFIQKLPQSYQYMTKVLRGAVLKGYSVVDEGSLSSLYPMLTGKFKKELYTRHPLWWNEKEYIDNYPFIWKDFQKSGYVTAFLEDFNVWASLDKRIEGFESMPTHHYFKPYYLAANDRIRVWSKFCSGSVPRHKMFLDYIKQMFDVYKRKKKFIFTFYGELSHNNYNALDRIDEDFLSFLRKLQSLNYLEGTLLVIMSDQGYKFSTIKDSLETKQEENLPFFYIRVPPKFARTRKIMYENFRRNSFALTTPFDIHATLKSLIHPYPSASNRSFSLFRRFLNERSCSDAQIHPNVCVCMIKKEVDLKSPIVQQMKNTFEETVNNATLFIRNTCAQLTIFSISNLTRLIPNENLSHYKVENDHYSMIAILLPGYTLYEAVFLHNLETNNVWLNLDDIISYDFGLQSRCIRKNYPELRQFCYCIDQTM